MYIFFFYLKRGETVHTETLQTSENKNLAIDTRLVYSQSAEKVKQVVEIIEVLSREPGKD